MADHMGRRAALLILFALLLQLSFSYAAQICPIDKIPTKVIITHSREPRNLAIGQPNNTISVTIRLTALENGSKTVPLPGNNLSVTLLMPTVGADGKITETYIINQDMTTDDVGEVSFEVSTGDFNPRKIKYVISAVFVPPTRSIYLGGEETETYIPGSISPISLAACFPFLLVGGLLMAALFAVGKDPFAFFDFSRVAFRPPPLRIKSPKQIRLEPGTLIKQAVGTLSAVKILAGASNLTKAYKAGKEAYNKELAAASKNMSPKQAKLAAKAMRRAAVVETANKAAEPSSTGSGGASKSVSTALLGGTIGGALSKMGAWTARAYRSASGKPKEEELMEGVVAQQLRRNLGRKPTNNEVKKEMTRISNLPQSSADAKTVRDEMVATQKKLKPISLGGARGEGATLISVSMPFPYGGDNKPSDKRKSSVILSARSYVNQGLFALKLMWKMGSVGFTKEGYNNPMVIVNVPKFGDIPVYGSKLKHPEVLAEFNKKWKLADGPNAILPGDISDSNKVRAKLEKQFPTKSPDDIRKLTVMAFRGTSGGEMSDVALQRVIESFSGDHFFPGRVASKLSKELPPEMKYVGKDLRKGKTGVAASDSERAIDPENKSRDAANKSWKTNLTGSDLNDPAKAYTMLVGKLGAETAQEAIADFYKGSKLTASDLRSLESAMTKPETDSQRRLLEYKLGNESERLDRMNESERLDRMKADIEGRVDTASKYEKEKQQEKIGVQTETVDSLTRELNGLKGQQAANTEMVVNHAVAIQNLMHQKSLNGLESEQHDEQDMKRKAEGELLMIEHNNLNLPGRQKELRQIISDSDTRLAELGDTGMRNPKGELIEGTGTGLIGRTEKQIEDTKHGGENIIAVQDTSTARDNLFTDHADLIVGVSKGFNTSIRGTPLNEVRNNLASISEYSISDRKEAEGVATGIREVGATMSDPEWKKGAMDAMVRNAENDKLKAYGFEEENIASDQKRKEMMDGLSSSQKGDMNKYVSSVEHETSDYIEKSCENIRKFSDYLSQEKYNIKLTPEGLKIAAEPKQEAEPLKMAVGPGTTEGPLQSLKMEKIPEKELPDWATKMNKLFEVAVPKMSETDWAALERGRAEIEAEMRRYVKSMK